MRKLWIVLLIGMTLAVGCTGVKTVTQGLENEAFLEFVGKPADYNKGVDVDVDGNTFNAIVNKDNQNRPKGQVYAISTGKHVITVSYLGKQIYKKQVFISAQETRRIVLP